MTQNNKDATNDATKTQPPPADEISELIGRLGRSVDSGLREMAAAIRNGATPYDAFLQCAGDFIGLCSSDIPQDRYRGKTWFAFRDAINARADAIINNTGGKYDDDTINAVSYAKEQMSVPGTEADLSFDDYARAVERAESGESLDADELTRDAAISKRADRKRIDRDLRRRAQAIIDDTEQPEQTREAVRYAIEHNRDAADIVRRAERGENLDWATTEARERDHAEWRDDRYGSGFNKLSCDEVSNLSVRIVNSESDQSEAMLLLLDEIERTLGGEYGSINVGCLCITIRNAVMPYVDGFSELAESVAARRRAKVVGNRSSTRSQ